MTILQPKTGDVVYLRSGGLAMTVAKIDGDVGEGSQTLAWITCQWHTTQGILMIGHFPIESLRDESLRDEDFPVEAASH